MIYTVQQILNILNYYNSLDRVDRYDSIIISEYFCMQKRVETWAISDAINDYNLNIFYERKKVSISGNRFSNLERIDTEQNKNDDKSYFRCNEDEETKL